MCLKQFHPPSLSTKNGPAHIFSIVFKCSLFLLVWACEEKHLKRSNVGLCPFWAILWVKQDYFECYSKCWKFCMQNAAYFTKIYEKIIKNFSINPSLRQFEAVSLTTTTPPKVSMSLDLYRHSSYIPPASRLPLLSMTITTTDYLITTAYTLRTTSRIHEL